MPDIIKLLPDHVANQIAAGEVIQRPASAVKELLENAIDSGASTINLILKDAGKALIQVVDNGCGMTETDARMSFERHATSKIQNANDLFSIRTKGFRGEALASIAAIAQVELKTKTSEAELGTVIINEGSEIKRQEPISCPTGTNFSIKNLFFNVPARRNFLKSNPVETRHIIDEFERVALTHEDIHFTMHHNENEIFNLLPSSRRQRVVNVFGKKFNERLVPIQEDTSILKVSGFIVKPEHAKRTRGEQFFFVNKRFIKNSYLNHAVTNAFRELISKDQFPSYFIYMDIPPDTIDINIHPTKTEIKFEDDKSIYAIINSSVRNSLGKYSIAPSLDFEQETSFNVSPIQDGQEIKAPNITIDPTFNPFKENKPASQSSNYSGSTISKDQVKANLNLLDQNNFENSTTDESNFSESEKEQNWSGLVETKHEVKTYQFNSSYIITQVSTGLLIIDQQRAHQQILFEHYLHEMQNNKVSTQKLLFPRTIELNSGDFAMLIELLEEINSVGFELVEFGKNTISVNGLPVGISESKIEALIELFIEQQKNNSNDINSNYKERAALNLARSSSIERGRKLEQNEMNDLVDQIFACDSPYYTNDGKKIIIKMETEEIDHKFGRK